MSTELNKKAKKALAWSSTTEVASKLVTPIVNIFLARLLLPEAFGLVATITMVVSFAEIFADAGFQKYIIQHEFSSKEDLNHSINVAFWTNIFISAVLFVLIFIFRNSIAKLIGNENLGIEIAVSSINILLISFSSIQAAKFKRDFDFKTLFFARITVAVVPLIVTVPLALLLKSHWALIWGSIAVNLSNAFVLSLKCDWKPQFFYSFKLLKKMLSFTMWTLMESILIWLTVNVDIFIVGNVISSYFLGIYKTAMTTVNSYMTIVTSSVMPVLFSTLSRYQNDEQNYRKTFWHYFKYASIIIIPMSFGVFLYSDVVTLVLLGSQWKDAVGFIGLWGLMSGFSVIFCNFASEVYRSKGNPKLSMFSQFVQILVMIPIILAVVRCDFKVLYTTRAILRMVGVVVNIIIMRCVYKFKIFDYIIHIIPSITSSAIMLLAGFAIRNAINALWWQIISIFICIVVYFTLLLLLFKKTRNDLLEIPFVKKIVNKIKICIRRNHVDKKKN